jgi:hypothetical protein
VVKCGDLLGSYDLERRSSISSRISPIEAREAGEELHRTSQGELVGVCRGLSLVRQEGSCCAREERRQDYQARLQVPKSAVV